MANGLPTVAFCGWGRAGKDTAGRYLGRVSPLRYTGSTSWYAKDHMARVLGVCEQEAWEDRHLHRQRWFDELNLLRDGDPLYFVKRILVAGEIVTGLRDGREIHAARGAGLISHFVWIDKPGVPNCGTVSYGPDDCDLVIVNGGTIDDFHGKLLDWFRAAKIPLY